MDVVLVNQDRAGAVHRLDGEILAIDLGGVHVLFVVIPVSGSLPELAGKDGRGLDFEITMLPVDLMPIIEQRVLEDHAIG
jgi:hypothetical protein